MEISDTLTEVERLFNIAGAIPVVSIVSAPLREAAGNTQAIVGLAIGIFGMFGYLLSFGSKKWGDIASLGGENLLHGILNSIRAVGEFIAGITIVGSIGLLFFQLVSPDGFYPMIKYNRGEQPIPDSYRMPPFQADPFEPSPI